MLKIKQTFTYKPQLWKEQNHSILTNNFIHRICKITCEILNIL